MLEDFTKYSWKKDGQFINALVDEGIDEDGDEFQTYYKILECHCRPGDESKFVMDLIMKLPKIRQLLKFLKRALEQQAAALEILETSCDVKKSCCDCEAVHGCQLFRELRETGKNVASINKRLVSL